MDAEPNFGTVRSPPFPPRKDSPCLSGGARRAIGVFNPGKARHSLDL
jgi:hypothetical protein